MSECVCVYVRAFSRHPPIFNDRLLVQTIHSDLQFSTREMCRTDSVRPLRVGGHSFPFFFLSFFFNSTLTNPLPRPVTRPSSFQGDHLPITLLKPRRSSIPAERKKLRPSSALVQSVCVCVCSLTRPENTTVKSGREGVLMLKPTSAWSSYWGLSFLFFVFGRVGLCTTQKVSGGQQKQGGQRSREVKKRLDSRWWKEKGGRV